jgi:hypothetical protein
MENRTMYCSGCDRDVRVLLPDVGPGDAQANVHDAEVICMELGDWCNGALCPLGAAEPQAMVRRLIQEGIPLDHLRKVRGWCDDCGLENDFVLFASHEAACTVCGTSRRRESLIVSAAETTPRIGRGGRA